MAVIRGQNYHVQFFVWNTSDGSPKTGDASNITVRIRKDGGTLTTTTNNCVEVNPTNAPGVYEILLTAAEMDANSILVVPQSSSPGVRCQSITILTDRREIEDIYNSVSRIVIVDYGGTNAVYAYSAYVETIANDAIGSAQLATSAVNEIASGILSVPANKLLTDTNGRVTVVSNLDKTGYTLTTGEHTQIQTDVSTSLDNKGYTSVRATRLDNLDATVSSRLAASSYVAPDNASISAIKSKTDNLTFTSTNVNANAQVVSDKTGYSLTSTERNNIASAVFSFVVDSGKSFLGIMRLISSALLGKVSGAQNNQPVFRDIGDTKNRITMTVDNDGNRSNVTLDDT